MGTWNLGTRDEGLEDIKYEPRGRGDVKNRDAGDANDYRKKSEVNAISLSS